MRCLFIDPKNKYADYEDIEPDDQTIREYLGCKEFIQIINGPYLVFEAYDDDEPENVDGFIFSGLHFIGPALLFEHDNHTPKSLSTDQHKEISFIKLTFFTDLGHYVLTDLADFVERSEEY